MSVHLIEGIRGLYRILEQAFGRFTINQILQNVTELNIDKGSGPLPETVVAKKLSTLSLEGIGAFECAVDPFHDRPIAYEGWPDAYSARSNKFTFTRQCSVRGDATTTNTSNFLFHFTPELQSVPADISDSANGPFIYGGQKWQVGNSNDTWTGAANFGGLMLLRNTVTDTFTPSDFLAANVTQNNVLLPFSDSTNPAAITNIFPRRGAYRCIGAAFEVRNVTNALRLQGNTTMYRMYDKHSQDVIEYVTDTGVGSEINKGVRYPLFPTSVGVVKQYCETKDLHAREGAYEVARFFDADNSPSYDDLQIVLMHNFSGSSDTYCWCSQQTVDSFSIPTISARSHPANFHSFGCFIVGCDPQTELIVTARWIIEYFPEPNDSDLLNLATPSADYDPLALQVVSHTMTQMPVGVPVRANAAGDWFKNLLSVAETAAPLMQAVPALRPYAGFIQGGVGVARSLMNTKPKEFAAQMKEKSVPETASSKRPVAQAAKQTSKKTKGKQKLIQKMYTQTNPMR